MLRSQAVKDFPQPNRGVNLRDPQHQLETGEVCRMQNLLWDGFIRPIPGVTLLTASVVESGFGANGGHRHYSSVGGDAYRLVAYGTKIVSVNDAGVPTTLTSTMTSSDNTYFATWSITSRTYISNDTDSLSYFQTGSVLPLAGTGIPIAIGPVVPVLDRMLCITTDGIERTDPRDDSIWSSNSDWATLRPQRPGFFTALHPMTLIGADTQIPGALAFQETGYYHVAGTDFGDDVTAGTASNGEDVSITLIDPSVGCSSPKAICTIPEIGTAWLTSDANIYFIPEGTLHGRFVGDKLRSNGPVKGLNSINFAAINKAWMVYHDRKLILGFPSGSNTYPDTQFWLDVRFLRDVETSDILPWYGPMTVDTWGAVWKEDQEGESRVMAAEGNSATGVFVYSAYQQSTVAHAIGSSTAYPTCIYHDRHLPVSSGKTSKYTPNFRVTAAITGGTVRGGVVELFSPVLFQQALDTYVQ